MRREYPILEFDAARTALIEPKRMIKPVDAPVHGVVCFFEEVIAKLKQDGRARVIAERRWQHGVQPLYEVDVDGQRLAVFHPGVGAPLAAALLEEVIARGAKKFIACGGAGVLDRDLARGHLVVPSAAVRDEGTSYHYLPPGREVTATPEAIAAIEHVLQAHHCPYIVGKTWTTDAPYRETAAKIHLRKAEGCLTVEMEAEALFAVAQFKEVVFGHILYGGDDLSSSAWTSRRWHTQASVREKLFWLAAEACLTL